MDDSDLFHRHLPPNDRASSPRSFEEDDKRNLCPYFLRLLNPLLWLQTIVSIIFNVNLQGSEKQQEIEKRLNQVKSEIQNARLKKKDKIKEFTS